MFSRITSSRKLSGFTLIEMLIVVVIIGILASTLIPRFSSIQGKARDTSRKASLQQLATALTIYQSEYGSLFTGAGNIGQYSGILSNYMGKIPKDPLSSRVFSGVSNDTTNAGTCIPSGAGEYQYVPLNRGGSDEMGFALVANPEDVAGANRIGGTANLGSGMTTAGSCIFKNTSSEALSNQQCERVVLGTTSFGTPNCQATKGTNHLRYVFIQ